jgi:hypothetical protein
VPLDRQGTWGSRVEIRTHVRAIEKEMSSINDERKGKIKLVTCRKWRSSAKMAALSSDGGHCTRWRPLYKRRPLYKMTANVQDDGQCTRWRPMYKMTANVHDDGQCTWWRPMYMMTATVQKGGQIHEGHYPKWRPLPKIEVHCPLSKMGLSTKRWAFLFL